MESRSDVCRFCPLCPQPPEMNPIPNTIVSHNVRTPRVFVRSSATQQKGRHASTHFVFHRYTASRVLVSSMVVQVFVYDRWSWRGHRSNTAVHAGLVFRGRYCISGRLGRDG